jgi:signal transduction histidine kinase
LRTAARRREARAIEQETAMTLKRDPSKAVALGFVVLLGLAVVQVSYWVYDQTTFTDRVEELVRPEASAELAAESARRLNRYLWEGAFFFAVLLGGMAILTRTIRHDAELRRRQQNFLAAVSHEFKSPLASIQLAAETLVMRAREEDTQRLGRRILDDGERLLKMIDNLLDTTRLEEGRHVSKPTATGLRAAVDAGVAEIAERARLSEIAVAVAVPDELAVHADPHAVETVLRNLLDNAVKACVAGNGRAIAVTAARQGRDVGLSVRDDGTGFPPDDAALIFEKFYRVGDELKRSMPGSGLGLYLVRRLVEIDGGSVTAKSAGFGSGAEFTVHWRAADGVASAPAGERPTTAELEIPQR